MSQSRNRWLVVLLCVNAVLLTAVIYYRLGLPQVQAQTGSSKNYVLVPAAYQSNEELLCIIDLAGQRITTCYYDKNRKRIKFVEELSMTEVAKALAEADADKQKNTIPLP